MINPQQLDVNEFDLSKSSLIEASAGTGKTYTISFLVLRLLLGAIGKSTEKAFSADPLDIENILVVTFTNAAAADLKARILEKIHDTRIEFEKFKNYVIEHDPELKETNQQINSYINKIKDPSLQGLMSFYCSDCSSVDVISSYSRLLVRAERSIDNASICTIHSFCNRALNQIFSFEAGRAFNIELTTDTDTQDTTAKYAVWREIFYTNEYELPIDTLQALLDISTPDSLDVYINNLKKARYINEKTKGNYYGFCVAPGYSPFEKGEEQCIEARIKRLLKTQTINYDTLYSELEIALQIIFSAKNSSKFYIRDDSDPDKPNEYASSVFNDKEGNPANIIKDTIGIACLLDSFDSIDSSNFRALYDQILGDSTLLKKCETNDFSFVKSNATFDNEKEARALNSAIQTIINTANKTKSECSRVIEEIKILISIKIIQRADELCVSDNLISNDEVLRQLAVALTTHGQRSETLASLLRAKYPVAMIDEFQDTDPVQFEIFNKLYLNKTAQEQKAVCYLIGDPKQSIYAFRGSDINSYTKAKYAIASPVDGSNPGVIYTLNTNYRSTKNVIEGVNRIFGTIDSEDDPKYVSNAFDYDENPSVPSNITFSSVNSPSVKEGELRFRFYGEETGINPISNYFNKIGSSDSTDPRDLTKKGPKGFSAAGLRRAIATQVALDVQRILEFGCIEEKGSNRKVKPNDIAILVTNSTQNECIQSALNELKIKSVYFSDRSSVLLQSNKNQSTNELEYNPTAEALNILYLMEAICDYSKTKIVQRLLGSSLLKYDYENFNKIKETDLYDNELAILKECKKKWNEYGFSSAFTFYMDHHEGIKHILNSDNGARELSNYFQIVELVQSKNANIKGATAQLLWLKSQLYSLKAKEFSEDETKKRLESELELVKIYTIHKSKGLQFPIVLTPFIGINTNLITSNFEVYYDRDLKHIAMPFDIIGNLSSDIQANFKLSKLQEDVRLLYVALTRAQAANFMYLIDEKDLGSLKDKATSAFRKIITPLSGAPTALKAVLNTELFKDLSSYTDFPENAPQFEKEALDDNHELAKPSELKAGSVDTSFTVTSYSYVVQGAHNSMFKDDNGEVLSQDSKVYTDISSTINFTFPKGSTSGDFLHKLMEDLLGASDDVKKDKYKLFTFISNHLVYDYYNLLKTRGASEDVCQSIIDKLAQWVENIVNAKLEIGVNSNEFVSLASLTSSTCARELEYFLPCENFSIDSLNIICNEFYSSVMDDLHLEKPELPDLKGQDFKGFMKGSLDLVSRFNTTDGTKYFMIDYKSNFLGNAFSDYHPIAIAKSIFEARYDVQILFYSLALHRLLKNSLSNYSYEKDFGGVMYLYLRGLQKDTTGGSTGVFYTKPSEEIITKLDRLFNGEKVL